VARGRRVAGYQAVAVAGSWNIWTKSYKLKIPAALPQHSEASKTSKKTTTRWPTTTYTNHC
jgi:hypothetical protein